VEHGILVQSEKTEAIVLGHPESPGVDVSLTNDEVGHQSLASTEERDYVQLVPKMRLSPSPPFAPREHTDTSTISSDPKRPFGPDTHKFRLTC
jgi:hypothetical protein